MEKIKAYDSAYAGSMVERIDGGYVERDDAESLAASLLALIKSGDRAAEDLQYRIEALTKQCDELLAACKLAVQQYESSGDFTMGGNLTNKPFLMMIEIIHNWRLD